MEVGTVEVAVGSKGATVIKEAEPIPDIVMNKVSHADGAWLPSTSTLLLPFGLSQLFFPHSTSGIECPLALP